MPSLVTSACVTIFMCFHDGSEEDGFMAEDELFKFEEGLTQLCREVRPLDDITVWVEQVNDPPLASYIIHFNRNDNGSVVNTEIVSISRLDIEDKSAGQKILAAINKV